MNKKLFLELFDNISTNENDAYLSDDTHLFIMSKYYALKNLDSFKKNIFSLLSRSKDLQSSKENLKIIKRILIKYQNSSFKFFS